MGGYYLDQGTDPRYEDKSVHKSIDWERTAVGYAGWSTGRRGVYALLPVDEQNERVILDTEGAEDRIVGWLARYSNYATLFRGVSEELGTFPNIHNAVRACFEHSKEEGGIGYTEHKAGRTFGDYANTHYGPSSTTVIYPEGRYTAVEWIGMDDEGGEGATWVVYDNELDTPIHGVSEQEEAVSGWSNTEGGLPLEFQTQQEAENLAIYLNSRGRPKKSIEQRKGIIWSEEDNGWYTGMVDPTYWLPPSGRLRSNPIEPSKRGVYQILPIDGEGHYLTGNPPVDVLDRTPSIVRWEATYNHSAGGNYDVEPGEDIGGHRIEEVIGIYDELEQAEKACFRHSESHLLPENKETYRKPVSHLPKKSISVIVDKAYDPNTVQGLVQRQDWQRLENYLTQEAGLDEQTAEQAIRLLQQANSNQQCDCNRPGCPSHPNGPCASRATDLMYRTDMSDKTGTPMCNACAGNAMGAGNFRDMPLQGLGDIINQVTTLVQQRSRSTKSVRKTYDQRVALDIAMDRKLTEQQAVGMLGDYLEDELDLLKDDNIAISEDVIRASNRYRVREGIANLQDGNWLSDHAEYSHGIEDPEATIFWYITDTTEGHLPIERLSGITVGDEYDFGYSVYLLFPTKKEAQEVANQLNQEAALEALQNI